MSPYLHFGQVAALDLALKRKAAARPGDENDEAYIEELIVRRENWQPITCSSTPIMTPMQDSPIGPEKHWPSTPATGARRSTINAASKRPTPAIPTGTPPWDEGDADKKR